MTMALVVSGPRMIPDVFLDSTITTRQYMKEAQSKLVYESR